MSGRSPPLGDAGRRLVLLVDDDDLLLDTLRSSLARLSPDLTFLTARSAEEALALLAQANVSLVVSDFRLPGRDGVAFLQEVARDFPAVRRVLLTGDPDRDLARLGGRTHAFDRMFIKPVDARRLSQVIAQLITKGARGAEAATAAHARAR